MIRFAKEVIVVADSTKFNHIAFTSVAPLKAVSKIVTDTSWIPQPFRYLKRKVSKSPV
jgi:DeoR/GlpR family transcriptional regulator of sugar metabolism